MIALIKREIQAFFSSAIGYLVIGVFLLINGLLLWVFKGQYNILDNGFADLSAFFNLAPWVFLFLIPAITMRLFSDEARIGTLELLLTKPISTFQLVLGKYIGAVILILLALVPTLLYILAIDKLGNPPGNWDLGSTLGSYIGLLLLALSYTAIGVFCSTLSKNQIVVFLLSVFLSFFFYYGFEGVSSVINSSTNLIRNIGMQSHFSSLARGVLDTKDVSYFIGVTVFFLFLTANKLRKKDTKKLYISIFAILTFIILGNAFHKRFDLTQDHRYSLSETAKNIISTVDSPLVIDVFLAGDLPSEFKKLQTETDYLLEEFRTYNPNVKVNFINPLEDEVSSEDMQKLFLQYGMQPAQISVKENGKLSTQVVYPWALAYYNDDAVKIRLLKNTLGATEEERINHSVQNLEYVFADGFSKLVFPKKRKVAVIKGNGEYDDKHIADFFRTLKEYYYIAPFTLDSVAVSPQKTLQNLKKYDLIVIANPTEKFSEQQKYVLDQYIMKGGKSLWLVDAVGLQQDTISSSFFAYNKDLNLTDFFFKYGVRLNPDLVKDVYCAPIVLATGQENNSTYNKYPWFYSPLSASRSKHPVVTNIEAVKFDYASVMDTLPNEVKKTILLSSSPLSKKIGVPTKIDINQEINKNLEVINNNPVQFGYNSGELPLAVLLEGKFTSVYNNRIKPFKISKDLSKSTATKMVVISDGDVIKNQLKNGRPLSLGFDKWTNTQYGNKEFLLNVVNYLLDDSGLIQLRTKTINIPFLDPQKTANNRMFWQIVTIVFPLVILGLFGLGFVIWRRKKYRKIS